MTKNTKTGWVSGWHRLSSTNKRVRCIKFYGADKQLEIAIYRNTDMDVTVCVYHGQTLFSLNMSVDDMFNLVCVGS
jgi:hypothetical protein